MAMYAAQLAEFAEAPRTAQNHEFRISLLHKPKPPRFSEGVLVEVRNKPRSLPFAAHARTLAIRLFGRRWEPMCVKGDHLVSKLTLESMTVSSVFLAVLHNGDLARTTGLEPASPPWTGECLSLGLRAHSFNSDGERLRCPNIPGPRIY